ncbi:glycosyltransferase family 4 protein [Runella sp.]|uniref:glycosyltransferase family 4 protein n=1 Tax=Runella sp. TaxID=1960881 RepID=UPI00261A22D3|nr:glycosyltransferase family 4 protein [Runella sp.]
MSLCFVEGQAQFWKQNGYDLSVVTSSNSDDGNDLEAFCLRNSIQIHPISFRRKTDLWHSFLNLRELIYFLGTTKPQIVHGNTPKAAFLTMIAARLKRIPIRIYEMHGLPLETATFWGRLCWWFAEKTMCLFATHVIAVSPSLRQSAIQKKLVQASKISVMHNGSCNGIDAENSFNPSKVALAAIEQLRNKYHLTENQPIVGFVGRLASDKGIQQLYDAWQIVKQSCPNAKLLLIGGEDERDKLPQKLLQKLDNDSSIIRLGHQKSVLEYYALMDFLVLPSYREGLGNVVLEAAAMNKPAIVSNVTGLKDAVVENQTGIFCQPRSAGDLAEKIKYYLQNFAVVQLHGKAARQRVQADFFPLDVWNAKWVLYRRLIAETESVTLQNVSPIVQTTD